MKVFRPTLLAAALIVTLPASLAHAQNADQLPRAKVALVARRKSTRMSRWPKRPKVVEFTMTIEEKKMVIDDKGTTLQAMTFDGSMPGPTLVVHEGDYVELTLVNPATNAMPSTYHRRAGRRQADQRQPRRAGHAALQGRPQRHLFHCAPEGMVPWHVVSGGTLMVLRATA